MPPPGSGALLAFILQLLSGMISSKKDDIFKDYQKIIEAFKHAYGRRTEFADPHFADISQVHK